jgi:hypothetical protein
VPFVPLADVQEYVDWLSDGGQLHFWLSDLTDEDNPDSYIGHAYSGFFDYLKAEPGPRGFLDAALVGDGVGIPYIFGQHGQPEPWAATCSTYLALSDPVALSVAINITIGEPPRKHHEYDMTDFVVETYDYDNPKSHVIELKWDTSLPVSRLGPRPGSTPTYAIRISEWHPEVFVDLRTALTQRRNEG